MRNWAGGRRAFGETGLFVSGLGMGCARLGSSLWQGRSDAAGRASVALAVDLGVSFFDTADVYGRGRSERLLGETLRGRRAAVVMATKCGLIRTPGRTDYIDILLLHSPPSEILIQDWLPELFHMLRERGEIRCWGVSARTDEDALSALEIAGIGCLEIPLNLCRAAALDKVIPKAASGGIAVIIRQPFASGALLPQRNSLEEAGSDKDLASGPDSGVFTPRACLQFVLQAPGVSTVIPGMTRPEHVRQNVAFANSQPLSRDEIQSIRDRICRDKPAGSHSA